MWLLNPYISSFCKIRFFPDCYCLFLCEASLLLLLLLLFLLLLLLLLFLAGEWLHMVEHSMWSSSIELNLYTCVVHFWKIPTIQKMCLPVFITYVGQWFTATITVCFGHIQNMWLNHILTMLSLKEKKNSLHNGRLCNIDSCNIACSKFEGKIWRIAIFQSNGECSSYWM